MESRHLLSYSVQVFLSLKDQYSGLFFKIYQCFTVQGMFNEENSVKVLRKLEFQHSVKTQ